MNGRIVENGCSRQIAMFQHQAIQKRFQRGTRLSPSPHPVHLTGFGKWPCRTDIRQHVPGGVVQHHRRTIAHIAIRQSTQLLAQCIEGQALHGFFQGSG